MTDDQPRDNRLRLTRTQHPTPQYLLDTEAGPVLLTGVMIHSATKDPSLEWEVSTHFSGEGTSLVFGRRAELRDATDLGLLLARQWRERQPKE